jgi:ribosomal protein S18 acetylase RimI-like enzyme
MNIIISLLSRPEIDTFLPVFGSILANEFPGYTKNVVRYFLEKIYTKENFLWWHSQNQKIIIAAIINGTEKEIVGFAIIDAPYGGVSFCRWLGIKKEFQRKGIGKQIIEKWKELALTSGCHKMEVASQPTAKEFYAKMGLELEGMRKLSYFGINQYIFGKVIGIPTDDVMINK